MVVLQFSPKSGSIAYVLHSIDHHSHQSKMGTERECSLVYTLVSWEIFDLRILLLLAERYEMGLILG